MKQLQPVIWTKGTFLNPQHLQVQDRFIEDTLNFRLRALTFCPWGFERLVIDQERLSEGQFLVSSASGIFPDGLLFDVPDADQPPPSKSVADFFEPSSKSLDIYLTIPDYRQRGVNVSLGGRDQNTRNGAGVVPFRDENNGLSEKPVQIARKNLLLLTEGENRQGSSVLRIARVERTEAGTFRLDPKFVPPLLNIRANEYLFGILRGLVEILSSRSSQLSSSRRQKNQSLAEFTAADIANFWLLYTVNSHFPVFAHFFETKGAHPEELYQAMVSLAGSLTTFSLKLRPRDIVAYDHDDLGACFSALDEKLRALLETVVPTNLDSLPLKLTHASIYSTALSEEKYLANSRMYLAVAAEAKEEEIIKRVPVLVKACSATHIDHLIKQALPGVPLKHLTSPPSAIPVKLKYQYFSISQSGAAWEAVRRARNFAVYVPGDFPNPELELLILMPENG